MRFGLRTTTEPHSTESQHADHRGTCCYFLQVHRELSSVYVTARGPNAHIAGHGLDARSLDDPPLSGRA